MAGGTGGQGGDAVALLSWLLTVGCGVTPVLPEIGDFTFFQWKGEGVEPLPLGHARERLLRQTASRASHGGDPIIARDGANAVRHGPRGALGALGYIPGCSGLRSDNSGIIAAVLRPSFSRRF